MGRVDEKGTRPTSGPRLGVRKGVRAGLFAWSLARSDASQRRLYGDRKRALFARLGAGPLTVVEVGAGAGPNAAFFPAGTRWIAVEPNVHFHRHLREQAARHGLDLEIRVGTAEALPVGDAEVDAVVGTLVLCSVGDPEAALAESRRVLKPGGLYVFVEHVAAPRGSGLRRMQRLVRAPWGWAGDGCRPDQETGRLIEAAGFASVEMETFRVPLGLASPHVAGVATA